MKELDTFIIILIIILLLFDFVYLGAILIASYLITKIISIIKKKIE